MLADRPFCDEDTNPLDSLEDVLSGYNWVFDRMNEEELFVKLTGKENDYNVYFIWDESTHLLQICCQYDLKVAVASLDSARKVIMRLNENLPLGHFYMPESSFKPGFRYSAFVKGFTEDHARQTINDLVDLSLIQCERFSSAFKMLSAHGAPQRPDLELALMETQGRS